MSEDLDNTSALHAYADRVLAGTGLTEVDASADAAGVDEDEGSAGHALRHGWDLARRAAKVVQL